MKPKIKHGIALILLALTVALAGCGVTIESKPSEGPASPQTRLEGVEKLSMIHGARARKLNLEAEREVKLGHPVEGVVLRHRAERESKTAEQWSVEAWTIQHEIEGKE